jgi:RNA polymerase sigma-70 factor (ECF subfamily)
MPSFIPPAPEEEADLVAAMAAGSEEALQDLHRRHAALVYHMACRSLDTAAAEEVTQDVFLAAWRKAGTFDRSKGSARTWLLAIARNRILDEWRARNRRPGPGASPEDLEVEATDPQPDEALWRDFRRRAVTRALAALPEPQRRALSLAYFAELSHEGVAEAMRIPLGTAKTRIRKALRVMQGSLGILVAVLLAGIGISGGRLLRDRARNARAVDLLANSSLRILKLYPPGSTPTETTPHLAFRGIPGRDLAVATLSHFPPPPPGARYVLWLGKDGRLDPVELPSPDREGKATCILEGKALDSWPETLLVTAESKPGPRPSGEVVATQRAF